jgi:hypothetical protein
VIVPYLYRDVLGEALYRSRSSMYILRPSISELKEKPHKSSREFREDVTNILRFFFYIDDFFNDFLEVGTEDHNKQHEEVRIGRVEWRGTLTPTKIIDNRDGIK